MQGVGTYSKFNSLALAVSDWLPGGSPVSPSSVVASCRKGSFSDTCSMQQSLTPADDT